MNIWLIWHKNYQKYEKSLQMIHNLLYLSVYIFLYMIRNHFNANKFTYIAEIIDLLSFLECFKINFQQAKIVQSYFIDLSMNKEIAEYYLQYLLLYNHNNNVVDKPNQLKKINKKKTLKQYNSYVDVLPVDLYNKHDQFHHHFSQFVMYRDYFILKLFSQWCTMLDVTFLIQVLLPFSYQYITTKVVHTRANQCNILIYKVLHHQLYIRQDETFNLWRYLSFQSSNKLYIWHNSHLSIQQLIKYNDYFYEQFTLYLKFIISKYPDFISFQTLTFIYYVLVDLSTHATTSLTLDNKAKGLSERYNDDDAYLLAKWYYKQQQILCQQVLIQFIDLLKEKLSMLIIRHGTSTKDDYDKTSANSFDSLHGSRPILIILFQMLQIIDISYFKPLLYDIERIIININPTYSNRNQIINALVNTIYRIISHNFDLYRRDDAIQWYIHLVDQINMKKQPLIAKL